MNVYKLSEEEREKRGIGQLPGDLWEAIKLAEESELMKKALGEEVFTSLIENKKIEWDTYRAHVTEWELDNYLSLL
jgi:glutamine synthetase